MKKISVVIPSYNESQSLPILAKELVHVLSNRSYEIIFADDGSSDDSLEVLKRLHAENSNIHYISLSKNFGHQLALKAGIDSATGDCVVMMDADLQHPPSVLLQMISKWENENYDVVFTVRKDDRELSFFKRFTSKGFYKLMNFLSDVKLEEGTADFRLLDKKVVEVISKLNDPFLFLRGLVPWLGFKQYKMEYIPDKRKFGVTKYSFMRMMKFATIGITSFSVKPLHFATIFGTIISLLAFCYGLYAVVFYFASDKAISGWASLLASILFIGGIQLLMLGIIGEYIGKIYMQIKNRPTYIINESSLK